MYFDHVSVHHMRIFFYLSLQVEIAPDDLTNLILSVFLLTWSGRQEKQKWVNKNMFEKQIVAFSKELQGLFNEKPSREGKKCFL